MAWDTELVTIVRHLINDVDSSSFTDARLQTTILVSTQLLQKEVNFDNTYTIDISGNTLSPGPTSGTRDDGFITLICLKSACIILGSETKTNALNAVRISDGPTSLDLTNIAKQLEILRSDICKRFEDAKFQYQVGNSLSGQAILSPYSPGSDSISKSARDGREGYFG